MSDTRTRPTLPALGAEQARAARPQESDVWLQASAGTGKTQVLTARVLRLLLHGARPETILCLTFTKAGAAEMANRIQEVLADWVRMKGPELAADLQALGEDPGPEMQDRARTLFARVLDARGGGLRIQTIHGFCQSLLAGFPAEADLVPGFRAIEGREEALLAERALADMVAHAERGGELGLIARLERLSHRLGEAEARALLRRCAGAADAMEALGAGIEARVRRWLSNGIDDIEGTVVLACSDGAFDRAALEHLLAINAAWTTTKGAPAVAGQKAAAAIGAWLAADPPRRYASLPDLARAWRIKDGKRLAKLPDDPALLPLLDRIDVWLDRLLALRTAAELAPQLADALILGQAYARAYAEAKRAAGVVDFNDLIARAIALLRSSEIGPWIAWKLDQATDHILVDEAQDTNASQWDIVRAIADEFYAGAGAKGDRLRTLFSVGDTKQAIFGFQGTDPREFVDARRHFTQRALEAEREPADLSLSRSFRSSQVVLDVVDALIETVGEAAMGLDRAPDRHRSATTGQSGSVTLWPPLAAGNEVDDEEPDDERDWVSDAERLFAADLARRVKQWSQGGLMLRNRGRPAHAGDILILVRSRGDLARLIVSRLYEEQVEVAGVDRLRLDAPIAVQDVMACIRFVLQPADDRSLAALLVSPLVGWSQETLYERARGRKAMTLWAHLGDHKPPELLDLLARADLQTPHRFIEHILSGPMQGRRRLIARLGEEARDPVEELVNAALAFEREGDASLQGFADWFDRGEVEITRDPAQAGRAVRVMTVHGAKGLQAPVVVLADATANPDNKRKRGLTVSIEGGPAVPVFRPRAEEIPPALAETVAELDLRERREHWRLLYVAMTRAEEHLFIGGALKPSQKDKGPGEDAWHARLEAAMAGMGIAPDAEGARVIERRAPEVAQRHARQAPAPALVLPAWLHLPAPPEARPARPLAPSAILPEDRVSDPPPEAAMRAAAERGRLLHALFERLPPIEACRRRDAADRWLARAGGVDDADARAELIDAALRLIDDPAFAGLFGPGTLAEAPLAGVVNGQVVAGTVDRLLIEADRVRVVDFKTGRRVPADAASAPPHHLAQMAAYAAVLAGIFPGRRIEAALLYTHGPTLLEVGADLLAAYKPGHSL